MPMRALRSLLLSALLLAPLARAQDVVPAAPLPIGAQNSLSFNLLNFASLMVGGIALDLNYTRALSPTLAFHVNPSGTYLWNSLGLGMEAGLRYFPFAGAVNGLWLGGKLTGGYGEGQETGVGHLVGASGSAQLQAGYTFVRASARDTGALDRNGFLLELGGSVGVGYRQINTYGTVAPAFGLRLAVGYAF